MNRITLCLVPLAFVCDAALAQVSVKDAWVRATVAQQTATGAFMKLHSSKATRLVEAKSPVAQVVEVHQMSMDNNVMKMRAISGLDLAAGSAVELKPGGYHVMLMGLKHQIKEGQTVPLMLVFEGPDKKREVVEVNAAVRALTASQGHMDMKH